MEKKNSMAIAEEKKTGISIMNNVGAIAEFNSTMDTTGIYVSLPMDSEEAQKIAYNAMNNADELLSDHIGEIIPVKDIVMMKIQLEDDDGEMVDRVRVIFVTPDGKTYASSAMGVTSSLKKLFAIKGLPTWENAINIIPRQVKTRKGYKTLLVELA